MSAKRTILLLEDNEERIVTFRKAAAGLGDALELRIWRDAPSMIADCQAFFSNAAIISLDHDLNPASGSSGDPGSGLDVARFLGDFMPVCPVLIHSSNTELSYSMSNELRFAGWIVDRIVPARSDWIESVWHRRVCEMIKKYPNTWATDLPSDHAVRLERMLLSLDGLGLGDALGEMFAHRPLAAPERLAQNDLPAGPWFHTDDTEMAISVSAVLKSHGQINQDALAKRFARRFERDPDRGYGSMTRLQMREITAGAKWRDTAANAFHGQGSMGNGSAMRIAPLGAYFANDLERCTVEARASSVVTHTHPEGIAGAVAVAVSSATAWKVRNEHNTDRSRQMFASLLKHTPEGMVRRGILQASSLPAETPVSEAARILGNGNLVTAHDTVPFCVWMAAHHLDNFVGALGKTISAGGDCDTNAAIVGGIVALSAGRENIPSEWLKAREAILL